MPPSRPRLRRRGNVAVIVALALVVILGFGALAIDLAYLRLAGTEAQDAGDAAGRAAVVTLRRTGDAGEAERAARAVAAQNQVGGGTPDVDSLAFGTWDGASFTAGEPVNAARVRVGRSGANAVPLFLGRVFGRDRSEVVRGATVAAVASATVLVVDLQPDGGSARAFAGVREAALAYLAARVRVHGPSDRVGLVAYTANVAFAVTPLTDVADEAAGGSVSATWARLDPPRLPSLYDDEVGSDPANALLLARRLLAEGARPGEARAVVLVTGTAPTLVPAGSGTARASETAAPWRTQVGATPVTAAASATSLLTTARALHDDLSADVSVVTLGALDPVYDALPQGEGVNVRVSDPSDLADAVAGTAGDLPVAGVE